MTENSSHQLKFVILQSTPYAEFQQFQDNIFKISSNFAKRVKALVIVLMFKKFMLGKSQNYFSTKKISYYSSQQKKVIVLTPKALIISSHYISIEWKLQSFVLSFSNVYVYKLKCMKRSPLILKLKNTINSINNFKYCKSFGHRKKKAFENNKKPFDLLINLKIF